MSFLYLFMLRGEKKDHLSYITGRHFFFFHTNVYIDLLVLPFLPLPCSFFHANEGISDWCWVVSKNIFVLKWQHLYSLLLSVKWFSQVISLYFFPWPKSSPLLRLFNTQPGKPKTFFEKYHFSSKSPMIFLSLSHWKAFRLKICR